MRVLGNAVTGRIGSRTGLRRRSHEETGVSQSGCSPWNCANGAMGSQKSTQAGRGDWLREKGVVSPDGQGTRGGLECRRIRWFGTLRSDGDALRGRRSCVG